MKIPESEILDSKIMEEGQASVRSHDDSAQVGSQAVVQGVENPHEIESVDSGAGASSKNVDINLENAAGTSSPEDANDAGPSSPKGGTSGEVGVRIDDAASKERLNERTGAEGRDNEENLKEGDPPHEENDPSLRGGDESAGTKGVQYRSPTFSIPAQSPSSDKSRDAHLIDIPLRDKSKVEELDIFKGFAIARTTSNFSVESASGDQCRICQQHTEEPLMELGCHCRGELAKAHRSCVDHWFGNKGTNKCEVCQHVATNVPLPSSQPTPHFWVWRVGGGPYNGGSTRRGGGVGPLRLTPLPVRPVLLMTLRRHPTIMLLWLLLFAFMAYLFVDVTDSASIGYAAMPIGFLFGVLVVLGLGTAARLVLECWHERVIRRNIQRMEEEPNFEDFPAEQTNIDISSEPVEGQSPVNIRPQTPGGQGAAGSLPVEPVEPVETTVPRIASMA